MADPLMDDVEQEEAVKRWLRENGSSLVIGVVLGLGALYGWRYYQDLEVQRAQQATEVYTAFVEAVDDQDMETARAQYAVLIQEFDGLAPAYLAGLRLAAGSLEEGDREQARAFLETVVAQGQPPAIRDLARVRLARLLVTSSPGKALEVLAGVEDDSYAGLAAELRGDAFAAQGETEAAREAYEAALASGATADPVLVERKLANLSLLAGQSS